MKPTLEYVCVKSATLSVLKPNSFCFRGAYRLSEVAASARPESLQIIRELQTKIQPDDGCVIQFSSVIYPKILCFCTVHCNIIVPYKPTKCTFVN